MPNLSEPTPPTRAPLVLDVEASGFGRNSYPIEVGFASQDGSTYCTLIRPLAHWTHWDPQAAQIHHISRDQLSRAGRPAAEVANALNQRLRGQTVYSDGWSHDYSWLAMLFDAVDTVPAFRLENLRILLTQDQADHWHDAKAQVCDECCLQRHRASSDALILQRTLLRVQQAYPATGDVSGGSLRS